jgi:hypothetical protein
MANYVIPIYVDYSGKLRKSRSTPDFYSVTNRVVLKRGDTTRLAIYFLDQITNLTYLLSPGTIVQVAMKPKGKYDSSIGYTCYGSTSATPSGGETAYYVNIALIGNSLDALLGVDGANSDDPAYIDLLFEISWSEDAGSTWSSTTDIVEARVYNDIIRSETDTPILPPTPPEGMALFPVYKETVSFDENASGVVILNLRSLFDVKPGEIGHFKISSVCTRRLDMAGDNPPPTAIYGLQNMDIAQGYAAVDLSSVQNYDGLPAVSNVFDEYDGVDTLGEVSIVLSATNQAVADDGIYKKASFVSVTFSHITQSDYSHTSLIGSVMVELIAIHQIN